MKRKGHRTLAICNVVGSTIAQEADGGIYLHAGPEIGVASTKAYTSQCMVLALLALYFGRMRHLSYDAGMRLIEAFHRCPIRMRSPCSRTKRCGASPRSTVSRQLLVPRPPVQLPHGAGRRFEAEGDQLHPCRRLSGRRMKHGPIALVDEHTPSVFIVPQGFVYDKVMSNLEEVKARGGPVIAVVENGDRRVAELADEVICVPKADDCSSRLSVSFRCSCWLTTSRCSAAATSINLAIWQRASRLNDLPPTSNTSRGYRT